MENSKNVDKDWLVLKASHSLSPGDTNSSTDTDRLGQTSTVFAMCEKDTKTSMPLSSLDLLTMVLPLTPEDSVSIESAHDETILYEDALAESIASDSSSTGSSFWQSQTDLDLPLPVDVHLRTHPSFQTKQTGKLNVVQLGTTDFQNQFLLQEEITKTPQTARCLETNKRNNDNEIQYQNECRNSAAIDDSENVDKDLLVLKASHSLSPGESNPCTEADGLGQTSTVFAMCEKDTETAMSLSSLDLLTMVLPLTPEDSVSIGSGHDETLLYEDALAESVTSDSSPNGSSFWHSQTDLDLHLPVDEHLQLHAYSQTKQADRLTVVQLETTDCQNQSFLPEEITKTIQTARCLETNIYDESDIQYQNACRNSAAASDISVGQRPPDATMSTKSSDVPDNCLNNKSQVKSKATNSLKFPPCVICNGIASGSHYGAITCEACKGFFRRYLQKKKEFKCTKGGKCVIYSGKKGNCSGCRLKKCLALGMSKEMSKLGRYTLTKRTEAIINMKELEGNKAYDSVTGENNELSNETGSYATSSNPETCVIIRYLLPKTRASDMSPGFNDMLIENLIQAMEDLEIYGPNVKTKEQIREQHKHHSERYKLKTELFGKMNRIPRDEYNKLYKEFGIDIDGRMADMKKECEDFEDDMVRYSNFAKHIPGFYSLSKHDQSSLMKVLMGDFYTIVQVDSFNVEFQTFISKNGRGYHYDEMADREYSAELLTMYMDVSCRLQKLDLSKGETALLAALTLVSTDRCKLQNRALVEKIQVAVTELLQHEIKKKQKETTRSRFTKIIDSLIYMREVTELFTKENNLLCKDEVLLEEFPFFEDFIIEEN